MAHFGAPESYCAIAKAEGIYLETTAGQRLIDGIGSWWCVNLGHSHPGIVRAIQEQAATLQHAMIGGISHPPAVALAEALAGLFPGPLNRVFFGADGSSAVEAALKLAVQYWKLRGKPEKNTFVALENAYHGDTIGAMEVGCISWFAEAYGPILRRARQTPSPHYPGPEDAEAHRHVARAGDALEALLATHHDTTAALVLEPLIQGAAGVRMYPPEYLQRAEAVCKKYDVLLILDEIATGFWRTGKPFALDHAGIVPDIVCVGKGLTGGYLPLSAFVATEALYEPFVPEEGGVVFWDGHTFCGNPITCAAALAAIQAYDELDKTALADRCNEMAAGFAQLATHEAVAYHRSLGMVGMIALTKASGGAARANAVVNYAMDKGLYIRPLGEVLYLWPPINIDQESLHRCFRVIESGLNASA